MLIRRITVQKFVGLMIMCLFMIGCVPESNRVNPGVQPDGSVWVSASKKNLTDLSFKITCLNSDGITRDIGTCFFVKHNGRLFVVTAWHVVEALGPIEIISSSLSSVPVLLSKPIRVGNLDVAIIPVDNTLVDPVSYSPKLSVNASSRIRVVGYGSDDKYHDVYGSLKTGSEILTEDVVLNGMSGSPVLDGNSVIGVLSAIRIDGRSYEMVPMFVIFDTLNNL